MVSDVLGVELSNDRTDASCISSAADEMAVTNAFTPSPLVSVSVPWLNESAVDPTTDINDTFPADLRFNENSLTVVIVYCVLFLVAAVGNLTVFITLFKSRHRKSRISLMITHLAVADLMVTFIMIPLEVGWRLTVQWLAGNLACKVFLFLRAFGLYLSSNVLVCVSLDRYFAILHPLRVNDARRRGKFMLACAWIVSLLWSVPQSIVFHVSPHPKYPSFYQCVSFGFFTSAKQEMAYNLFCVLAVYFFPLIVILVSYTAIMCEISHKSKETNADCYQPANGRMRLRRSDMTNIERARSRTLKMTVTIVVVFVWCWTPYVVMTLWYMFDRDSAAKVANWIQDALFMMAVSNSCMNPMVYGSYAMNFRKECSRCLGCCVMCPQDSPSRLARKGTVGSATRSTAMLHGVMRSPAGTPQTINHTTGNHLAKSPVRTIARPPSVGHISLVSEPLDNGGSYRPSFHSDPTGQSPFLRAERNVSNIELYSHNMDVECTSTRPIL